MSENKKIVVGMSGGVDSSVAALLLKQQGWDVIGLFMKNWEEDDTSEYCAAATDLADAQAVCNVLDIPLHTVNFSSEYWDNVFAYFLAEYRAFRTPNPDILCNKEIKFKAFLNHALALGATAIATGHYAAIEHRLDGAHLMQCKDDNKDQTYFLHALSQQQLNYAHFPLANIDKPAVRRIAEDNQLPNHRKKDSTGICFIGEKRFKDFLSQYIPANPGDIITEDGKTIGQHSGLMYYTMGQRQGLGIGGVADADERPWFVSEKKIKDNQLVVVQGNNHPALLSSGLIASQIHWIGKRPELEIALYARCRHRQPLQLCTIDDLIGEKLTVKFAESQRAITPGQSIVFYQNGECLGGAIIEEGIPA